MLRRWNQTIFGIATGMTLVGCSFLTVQGSRYVSDPALRPAPRAEKRRAITPTPVVSAGPLWVSPVIVEPLGATRARITWRSPVEGESMVLYGTTSRLVPFRSRTEEVWGSRIELSGLKPGTRYFFLVETRAALGLARSAVCSFRTH